MLSILAHALSGKLVTGLIAIWLKDEAILQLGAKAAMEAVHKKTGSYLEKRKVTRLLEQIEDDLLESLAIFLENEFRSIKKGDKALIVESAVALVTTREFYDACFEEVFDQARIARHFDDKVEAKAAELIISDVDAVKTIHGYVFAKYLSVISELPTFSEDALRNLLGDTDEILDRIRNIEIEVKSFQILEKQRVEEDEKQYRKLLARKLKKISIFGLDSRGLPKRYSLTIAYINLTLSTENALEGRDQHEVLRTAFSEDSRLIVIKGEPGSGKTTLLSWIALNCAEFSLPKELSALDKKLPIFVRIREYASRELPKGSAILKEQLGVACDNVSEKWIDNTLKTGEFLFFLDGFDEVVEKRRAEVLLWVQEILELFPNSKVVLSTRPYTDPELRTSIIEYCPEEAQILVEPMSTTQVTNFINSWYQSFGEEADSSDQRSRFEISRDRLLERLNHNSSLRTLIRNPLICSLICFVNADRDGFVPDHRGDLYRLATETLIDRRERERGILEPTGLSLTVGQKFKIMGYVSEYFFKRRSTQLPKEDVANSLKDYLPALALKDDDAEAILDFLCQRSHVLRSPGPDEIDFSHKTFLEYFYAKRLAEQGMFEEVTDEFFLQEFREVVLFAFSVGPAPFIDDVLVSVMHEIRQLQSSGGDISSHVLVLQTAIQQASEVRANLRREAIELLEEVLPPKSTEQAVELASGGEVILESLKEFAKEDFREYWRFVVLAALNTFSEDAVYALIPFAEIGDPKIDAQLVNGRKYFESDEFRKIVIAKCKTIKSLEVRDWSDLELVPSLPKLVRIVVKGYDDKWSDVDLPIVESIRTLEVYAADSITDLSILRKFPNLRELTISDCSQLDDFSGISECLKLNEITIHSFSLSNLDMLEPLKDLQFLDVADSTDLTDVKGIRETSALKSLHLPYSHLYDKLPQQFEETSVEIDYDFFIDDEFDGDEVDFDEKL